VSFCAFGTYERKHVDEIDPTGVNFINILKAAFWSADPKSAKRQCGFTAFLRFWDLRM
jgi:hypothetical protein